jgi:outer membrane protein OmpA-like peptidoglycan-associated protein/tetratricopeptide (TPR) repeat protein
MDNRNKRFFLSIFLLLNILIIAGQERIYIDKGEFKQTEEGFDEAWDNIKQANFLFYQHRYGSYKKAIPFYLQALEYNSENAELNLLTGLCYLRSWPKEMAAKYIEKACDIKPNVHPKSQYLLAKAYHCAYEFNKAIIAYNDYKDNLSENELKENGERIFKYIDECENGIVLKKTEVRALIDLIDSTINSPYDDYNPILTDGEKKMIFTSRRGSDKDLASPVDHKYYENIFSSEKEDKKWIFAKSIGAPVNSKWNDAAVALSKDGKKLIIYRGRTDGGDIFSASFIDNQWQNIHDLTNKLNKGDSHESSVCFNADGTKMYFISNKDKDSYGGHDIYVSELDEKGKRWSKAVNLGSTINTIYDEISVYLSPDESTLYFSSNGHKSIGGFDIFKSVYNGTEWGLPVNIGVPVNSTVDDLYLKIMPNGHDAYFCSDRKDGVGDLDIYHVTLLGPEKPLNLSSNDDLIACIALPDYDPFIENAIEIKYTRMTIVKGTVSDFNNNRPLLASVELVDNSTGKVVKVTKSDQNTGFYSIALPSGSNYGFSVSSDGYMFHSENFNVPAESGYKEIFKDIALQPMTAGSKIILYNTFFETGKSNLRTESFSELNRVASMFVKYPRLILEISGHTDNRGSVATNKKLSKARAESVKKYLIGQGVNPSNLQSVGYDFKYPVADNKTAEGRQQNRRVEAKIISN